MDDEQGNLFMNVSTRTPSRLVMTIAFTITALLLGIIAAVAAGTGTVTPPPKIAFVTTNANVAPDALTVGPMAGRLGAPLFITNGDTLGESTKDALVAYGADLIIIAGGPNTISDAVMTQIAAATGKALRDIADTPNDGVVRVAGSGRDQTAVALSELIAAYHPKFLPTDATAVGAATAADADLLDGKDSTAFLGKTQKAADAEKLDGIDSTGFLPSDLDAMVPVAQFAFNGATGALIGTTLWRAPVTGEPVVTRDSAGVYLVDFPGMTYFYSHDQAQCMLDSANQTLRATSVDDGDGNGVGDDLLIFTYDAATGASEDASTIMCSVWSLDGT